MRTLGIDEVEVRGPLELGLTLDLISPLSTVMTEYQHICSISTRTKLTIAAGPREKFHVEPRVSWTNERELGAKNSCATKLQRYESVSDRI